MDFNLDVRLKQLQSLEHYISSSWNKVHSVLNRVKWDMKEVTKDNQLIKCSVDPNHRVDIKTADEHIQKCTLRKEGYSINEHFLSEPLHDKNNSIFIDDHQKIDILSSAHRTTPNFKSGWNGQDPDPKTADRLITTFSSDERLALYTHAISNTVGPPELPEYNINEPAKPANNTLTYEELLIHERDSKRRRVKYKSVHTNRKNHTEVLREVIDAQMQLYKNWLDCKEVKESKVSISNELEEKECDTKRSSSVISRNSTHSSSHKSNSSHLKNYSKYADGNRDDSIYYKKHRNNYKTHKSTRREERKHNGSCFHHSRREDRYTQR